MFPKRASRLALSLTLIGLAGCGSQYEVAHLEGPAVPEELPEPGIYYSLPLTEIVVRIPVTRTITKHSRYSFKFKENVEACQPEGKAPEDRLARGAPVPFPLLEDPDDRTPPDTTIAFKRGRVGLFTRAKPDPLHRYRLDVSAGALSEFQHTVKVTEAGLLTDADTRIADTSAAFALATARSIVQVVGSAFGIPTAGVTSLAFIDDPAAASPPAPPIPTCAEILAIAAAVAMIDSDAKQRIDAVERERKKLLLNSGLASRPETLAKSIAYLDGLIAAIKKAAEKKKKAVGALPKKVEVSQLALFGKLAPDAFTPFDSDVAGDVVDWRLASQIPTPAKDAKVTAELPNVPGGIARDALEVLTAEELARLLGDWQPRITVDPTLIYAACSPAPCAAVEGDGYRYRLPANGSVIVTMVPPDSSGQARGFDPKEWARRAAAELEGIDLEDLEPEQEARPPAEAEDAPPAETGEPEAAEPETAEPETAPPAESAPRGPDGEGRIVVAMAEVQIAQYGPIARLPAKFGGLEGNIALGLYSDFGTLKEITVGAKAQSPETVSGFGGLISGTIDARRAAREAEKAEREGQEKAALTEQRDLLQLEFEVLSLQKQIRELEASQAAPPQ